MRIIIIGASGLIGHSLHNLAKMMGKSVIGTYNTKKENDFIHFNMLKDSALTSIPDLGKTDIVYILSAYSNPSWIYENQTLSKELNLDATKRLIDDVMNTGARIIFMSSVEVFDGKVGNYNEESIPNPLNCYGRMKFEIEKYLSQKNGLNCIVRTGWNVGWSINHRCVIKLTYETLLRPDARMAKDNVFSIIDVNDTAKGLLMIGENNKLRICHLASTPPVCRIELAEDIISLSKYKKLMSYEEVMFKEIPYSEPRGRLNHLDNLLATSSLGISFRSSDEIIREKVKFLDSRVKDFIE
jgi:dTDP-4-dehydrorhamnose reductase